MREGKTTAERLIALSDTVFAVIVTVMVLELKAPDSTGILGSLAGIVNLGNLLAVSPPRTTANLLICGPCVGQARLKLIEICLNLTMPFRIITDKLKSYAAASRTILPGATHDTQQSRRDFASAYSNERTTNAPIQITPTSSALSIAPRCRPESILRCGTFAEIDSSPTLKISVHRGLAKGNGGLTISNSPSPINPNAFRIALG
jgi:hypothetical protein